MNMCQRNTGANLFRAALLTIAKIQTQPMCPLANEWIKKVSAIQWNIFSYKIYNDFYTFDKILINTR